MDRTSRAFPLPGEHSIILGLLGAALAVAAIPHPPVDLAAVAGFYVFFLAPGLLLIRPALGGEKVLLFERLPLAIALSMAVWVAPGLLSYVLELDLAAVAALEAAVLAAVLLLSLWSRKRDFHAPELDDEKPLAGAARHAPFALGLLSITLALWFGAFRSDRLDWDYFNYISAVRKLLAWDKAGLAHFAFRDAPPDPIHSYNVWALQWALIAKFYRLDPIVLYLRGAILTIPAAVFAFHLVARKAIGPRAGLAALVLHLAYHLIYGGMNFLGVTTFFPDDSQWLIVFPTTIFLLAVLMERAGRPIALNWRLHLALALSALAMSVTHVLWGLAFYLTGAGLIIVKAGHHFGIGRKIVFLARAGKSYVAGPAVLLALPYLIVLLDCANRWRLGAFDGRTPLLDLPSFDPPPLLILLFFVLAPALLAGWRMRRIARVPDGSPGKETGLLHLLLFTFILCGVIALPYAWLRFEAVRHTAWEQFGRNPYRCFITPGLFYLNPFARSLDDPNHTFYPLYIAGYLCLPALWFKRRERPAALIAVVALLLVPLIVFHPALATLFTQYFSMGYLRRILRLTTLFSFLPLALVLDRAAGRAFKRAETRLLATTAAAVLIAAACIPFPAEPFPFNHMLKKRIAIEKTYPPDSLIFPDEPFRAMKEKAWFKPGDVLFSDVWTSYRLTAYLPLFVAVQVKPGAGVADLDERRLLEDEFFAAMTTVERMREIADRFGAAGVIVNVNPGYRLYDLQRGRPEAAAKLKGDPAHFEMIYEKDDWVIFRRTGAK